MSPVSASVAALSTSTAAPFGFIGRIHQRVISRLDPLFRFPGSAWKPVSVGDYVRTTPPRHRPGPRYA
jgi:hypothetical protein